MVACHKNALFGVNSGNFNWQKYHEDEVSL
jgi:hypothetical protein